MNSTAHAQALAQVSSIVALVTALDVDYDQLDALRSERDDYASERADEDGTAREKAIADWTLMFPSDAAELAEREGQAGDCTCVDDAQEAIDQYPLSCEVRSGWSMSGEDLTPEEFRIVLCTGGPHVEIVGDLDHNGSACSVRVRYRDWSESGELFDFDRDAVLRYVSNFFGG